MRNPDYGQVQFTCGCFCRSMERASRSCTGSFDLSIGCSFWQINGEGLQILHYTDGEKYEPHHDFFHDKFNSRPENGGQRIATVLMYL